uniref:Uncharacterized protein n=1 Tax=Neogobius melanostomus TaxID=47308 RepID=A0A8C6SS03_9GOBI
MKYAIQIKQPCFVYLQSRTSCFSHGTDNGPKMFVFPDRLYNDGKLSFEEFNTYFADGILTTEELQELFYSIDGRQNNLNISILKAMDKTKESKPQNGFIFT